MVTFILLVLSLVLSLVFSLVLSSFHCASIWVQCVCASCICQSLYIFTYKKF